MTSPPLTSVDILTRAASAASTGLLLLLDFDGTLVEIAPTPDAIVVPATLSSTLQTLRRQGHVVVIISGRERAFILSRVDVPADTVVGLHGLEWPGEPRAKRDHRLDSARKSVEAAVAVAAGGHLPAGLLIEDKGLALGFHVRLVDAAIKAAIVAAVEAGLSSFVGDGLTLLHGHEVIELRPSAANKGNAIARLLAANPGRSAVFIGDDVTDEEAFAALPIDGVSIRVGPPGVTSRARWLLPSPAAVRGTLIHLAEQAST